MTLDRRLQQLWLLVAGIVAALILGIVAVIVHSADGRYGPVSAGPFDGMGDQRVLVPDEDQDGWLLRTTGDRTAYYYASLGNDGEHPVRVTGIDTDEVTVRAQWAPVSDADGAALLDYDSRWRDFPALVSDRYIQVRYEIRRPPRCQDKPMQPGSGSFYDDSHVVHWESLLGDREHTTRIYGSSSDRFRIQVC